MKLPNPLKISVLAIGDIAALYASLLAMLFLRYGWDFNEQFINGHAVPFSIVFPLWLLIFYIAGLYDLPRLRNNLEFLQTLSLTLFINALVTIAVFYLVPSFGITPKTNLFIFIIIFAVLESAWRRSFNIRASFREGLNRVLLLDKSPRAKEMYDTVMSNPQLGYTVVLWLNTSTTEDAASMRTMIKTNGVNLVVVPSALKHDTHTAKLLYELLASGIEVWDVISFYEKIHRKVPIEDVSESWFIDHAIGERKFYDDLKHGLEVAFAVILGICLAPLLFIIALFIRLTSSGPAIYKQKRVGKNGHEFMLYKFRSMKVLAADGSAEPNGAVWSGAKDNRTTPIGRFLRASHLDELPQLWNIIRGELSFAGPRPERPEIVKKLIPEIPYYEIRLIVNPGITGWAQINYRKDATTKDVMEKVSYDVYYLKNRSLVLDFAIIIKTIKSFFVNHE